MGSPTENIMKRSTRISIIICIVIFCLSVVVFIRMNHFFVDPHSLVFSRVHCEDNVVFATVYQSDNSYGLSDYKCDLDGKVLKVHFYGTIIPMFTSDDAYQLSFNVDDVDKIVCVSGDKEITIWDRLDKSMIKIN